MADRTVASRAAAALAIRRAVAPALLHGIVAPDAWAHAATLDREAWRLFLRVERCAHPLQRALTRERIPLPADAPARAVIAAAAVQETARILVARTHLRTAAAVAGEHGLQVAVLKGGALAAGDDPVDLVDVDLLMSQAHSGIFSPALQQLGWQTVEGSTARVDHSLLSNDMKIEVHLALGLQPAALEAVLWEQSEALEALAPLRQLGPLAHLHQLVQHVSIHHLNRRGRIRDQFVIARAARRCTPSELAAAFAGPGDAERVCRATLDAATKPRTASSQVDDDRRAVMGYVLALQPPVPFLPREVNEFVEYWCLSMLQTPWERRQVWSSMHLRSLRPSIRPYIRAVEQRHAALGRAWRVSARAMYRAATWALARPIARRVRRTAAQALQSPVLQGS